MTEPTLGTILAGGLARRLGGGDKALRMVGGKTVLARLVGRFAPQVTQLILNANDDAARFNEFGLPVVSDDLPDRPGPLAGVLAGLDWTAQFAPDVQWVVTAPGDAPFLPLDLVARLHAARGKATLACAASGGQTHPVAALWPVALRHDLRHALTVEKLHKVGAYMRRHEPAIVEWPIAGVDPFFNVNTPADLAEADRLAGALSN
jgi:molybdopterin-guanine dinucleotide biosynthesis protein A